MSANAPLRLLVLLLVTAATVAAAASPESAPPRDERAALVANWRAQGLQPVRTGNLDVVYVRPGALDRAGLSMQLAPVTVELREGWQQSSRDLGRVRMRPAEVQRLKDEVALIVTDELRQQLAEVPGAGDAAAPVLEARVVDLYLNAPDMQTAAITRTYTQAFGDMALVAELRDRRGGKLLFASWEHRPAREFTTLRLTTRVDNAIEVRAAAHAWARQLRRELDRLGAGH